MPAYNSLEKRSQNSDKQGAIERYYALLGSGDSVGSTSNTIGPLRSKSEHGDTVTAESRQSKIDGVLTDVTPEIALVGTAPEKAGCTRGLSVPLSHETESCRTEEPQAAESAPLNKLGLDDRRQLLRESLPGSEPDSVRLAGAYTYASREEAVRSGDQKRLRFGKFPRVRKRIAFGALCTVIAVSVSIAGFSIVRGGRDAEPTTTRVQSDVSSRTAAIAIPGSAAGRLEAVVGTQKPQKEVTNADSSQAHKPSRPAEPDSAVPGTLQSLTVGVRETGSAAQREVGAPQPSNAGQADAIQQSTAPATAPRDPAHEPTPLVAQSLSATPKGSAETAPHSDTGQPLDTIPKDEPKTTATAPTKNVSAALPSRGHAAERRRASPPRRDAGSRRHIRQRTPTKSLTLDLHGACRKLLALTARQAWRSTLPSGSGGPHDPECDCREAEASVQGRLQGPALPGIADRAGGLLVSALSAQLRAFGHF